MDEQTFTKLLESNSSAGDLLCSTVENLICVGLDMAVMHGHVPPNARAIEHSQ